MPAPYRSARPRRVGTAAPQDAGTEPASRCRTIAGAPTGARRLDGERGTTRSLRFGAAVPAGERARGGERESRRGGRAAAVHREGSPFRCRNPATRRSDGTDEHAAAPAVATAAAAVGTPGERSLAAPQVPRQRQRRERQRDRGTDGGQRGQHEQQRARAAAVERRVGGEA